MDASTMTMLITLGALILWATEVFPIGVTPLCQNSCRTGT